MPALVCSLKCFSTLCCLQCCCCRCDHCRCLTKETHGKARQWSQVPKMPSSPRRRRRRSKHRRTCSYMLPKSKAEPLVFWDCVLIYLFIFCIFNFSLSFVLVIIAVTAAVAVTRLRLSFEQPQALGPGPPSTNCAHAFVCEQKATVEAASPHQRGVCNAFECSVTLLGGKQRLRLKAAELYDETEQLQQQCDRSNKRNETRILSHVKRVRPRTAKRCEK